MWFTDDSASVKLTSPGLGKNPNRSRQVLLLHVEQLVANFFRLASDANAMTTRSDIVG
jgi:hypothetical protein